MPDYKSAILGKAKKISKEEANRKKRFNDFMVKRRSNRKAAMSKLRSERLKLNKMSRKDIGK